MFIRILAHSVLSINDHQYFMDAARESLGDLINSETQMSFHVRDVSVYVLPVEREGASKRVLPVFIVSENPEAINDVCDKLIEARDILIRKIGIEPWARSGDMDISRVVLDFTNSPDQKRDIEGFSNVMSKSRLQGIIARNRPLILALNNRGRIDIEKFMTVDEFMEEFDLGYKVVVKTRGEVTYRRLRNEREIQTSRNAVNGGTRTTHEIYITGFTEADNVPSPVRLVQGTLPVSCDFHLPEFCAMIVPAHSHQSDAPIHVDANMMMTDANRIVANGLNAAILAENLQAYYTDYDGISETTRINLPRNILIIAGYDYVR